MNPHIQVRDIRPVATADRSPRKKSQPIRKRSDPVALADQQITAEVGAFLYDHLWHGRTPMQLLIRIAHWLRIQHGDICNRCIQSRAGNRCHLCDRPVLCEHRPASKPKTLQGDIDRPAKK